MSGRTTAGIRRASGGVEKAWASGRILTPEQRARKQEADRKANRFLKKEVQDRLTQLEQRVLDLEKTSASEEEATASRFGSSGTPYDLAEINRGGYVESIADQEKPEWLETATAPSATGPDSKGMVYEASTTNDDPLQGYLARDDTDLKATVQNRPEGRHLTCFLNNLVNYIRHLSTNSICFDDAFNQDLVVSAVMKGWDLTLSRYGQKCPLWEVLKLVDVYLFKDNCNVVERVGCMRMLHKRYLFEVNAKLHTAGPVPPWYRPQFSESVFFHDPVIDHLPWPSLRERLIASEEDRMTNKFWLFYLKNMCFTWRSEPLDIMSFNRNSNMYQLTLPFEAALIDIDNWRMGMDFFRGMPQLAGDVPPFNYMPLRTLMPKFGSDGAQALAQDLIPQFGLQEQQQQQQPQPHQESEVDESWWQHSKGLARDRPSIDLQEIPPAPGGVWQDFYPTQ